MDEALSTSLSTKQPDDEEMQSGKTRDKEIKNGKEKKKQNEKKTRNIQTHKRERSEIKH